jgi:HAD superfamily hydrolase (TIGR01662 family)
MRIRAVLFDMFDTLMLIEKEHAFYSPALQRLHSVLVKNGVSVSYEEFIKAYTVARDTLFAEADKELEEPRFNLRVSNALRDLGYEYEPFGEVVSAATYAFCEGFMDYVRIDPDTEGTLRKLHENYKIGIVSNFAIPECVYNLLEKHGLEKFFDVVIVSAEVNKRKPSPEIFQQALKKLGVTASETVFVGDTLDADIKGAKDSGMKAVYLERRNQKEIENLCPDYKIKSLNELVEALKLC